MVCCGVGIEDYCGVGGGIAVGEMVWGWGGIAVGE